MNCRAPTMLLPLRRPFPVVLLGLVALASSASLGGCSTTQRSAQAAAARADPVGPDALAQTVDSARSRIRSVDASMARAGAGRLVDDDEVPRAFIAGAAVPLAPEAALPAALRQGVSTSLLFRDGRRDLLGVAEAITRATGIPVRVKPDALMPLANFLPRTPSGAATGPAAGAPAAISALDSAQIELRAEDAPLSSVLDRIASRLALSWRYDGRAIELYRLESRTFSIKALPVRVGTQAGLGRSAAQNAAFDHSASTRFKLEESDAYGALRAAIEARMTRAGIGPVITPETGTLVVTDTPESLDAIGAYLERENRLHARRIDLVFEAVQVRLRDGGHLAVDWSLVYERLRNAVAASVALRAPGVSVSGQGTLSGGVQGGRMDGSALVVSALAELGTVVSTTRVPIQTTNRRPASYAVRTTFNYVDQASAGGTPGATSGSLVTGSTVSQRDETVGTVLTLVADVDDDGVVSMSVSYDNTALTRLEPFTVGSGSQAVTVQQKEIEGAGVLQQFTTRVGVPTVIGGFERSNREASRRRLGSGLPTWLGGADRAQDERSITVLMVTALARDGL